MGMVSDVEEPMQPQAYYYAIPDNKLTVSYNSEGVQIVQESNCEGMEALEARAIRIIKELDSKTEKNKSYHG